MYGHTKTGIGALILLMVALLHKMVWTAHHWATHKAHAFRFEHRHIHWYSKHRLMHAIKHLRHVIRHFRRR